MRILVTGAAGFLGSHLVEALAATGNDVRALVLDPGGHALAGGAGTRDAWRGAGIEERVGDVTRPETLAAAVEGCEVVHHLAGRLVARGASRDDYFRVNLSGTENVVRAAVSAGVRRVVFASSVGVYGIPRRPPADELTPPAPLNAYQASKLAAEEAIARLVAGSETAATIARVLPVYGPRDPGTLGLFRAAARGRVWMVGSGARPFQLAYVGDVIEGLCRCGARTGPGLERFVVGPSERVTVRELIDAVVAAVGGRCRVVRLPEAPFALAWRVQRGMAARWLPRPGRVDRLDFFLAERTWDVSRAARELGLPPGVALADGLARTAAWYRRHGLL